MTEERFTLSSEPPPAKRQRLIPESVELLIEHPFADREWAQAMQKLTNPREKQKRREEVRLVNISPEKWDCLRACSCAGHTGVSWIR
jgi:hypothetical protein